MKRKSEITVLLETAEEELEIVEGLSRRLRLTWLLRHFPPRPVWAGFVLFNSFITVAMLSIVAMVSRSPFVFPSLGPTAYLLFFNPRTPASSPKHTICGHLIGLVFGYAALWACGLQHAPSVTAEGINTMRMLAAAFSLSATAATMVLLSVGHPPAGATTLVVSLGFITDPWQLLIIEAAVVVLVIYTIIINRAAGIDYPLWSPRCHPNKLPRPTVT